MISNSKIKKLIYCPVGNSDKAKFKNKMGYSEKPTKE